MKTTVREIQISNDADINSVTALSMMAIWELIPESMADPSIVNNFDYGIMRKMYGESFQKDNVHCFVATDDECMVGYSIVQVKQDDKGQKYGRYYSRYVRPNDRGKGIDAELVSASNKWLANAGACYLRKDLSID